MQTPLSITIVLWIAGLSWALAISVYLMGGPIEWIFPLFTLGALIGIAEMVVWQRLG